MLYEVFILVSFTPSSKGRVNSYLQITAACQTQRWGASPPRRIFQMGGRSVRRCAQNLRRLQESIEQLLRDPPAISPVFRAILHWHTFCHGFPETAEPRGASLYFHS